MRFSVVIPLYNKSAHIERTINSVLNQDFKDYEIIVVNDGSTDGGEKVVEKMTDHRINLINKVNEGVSAARNTGIEYGQGEYIAFLDGDDAWEECFLSTIDGLIRTEPEASAFGTAYTIKRNGLPDILSSDHNGLPKGWSGKLDDYFKYMDKMPLLSASSIVVEKEVFGSVGRFPIGIKRGEDLDTWIRIALSYDVAYSNLSAAIYYQDTDNRACFVPASLETTALYYSEQTLNDNLDKKGASDYFVRYMHQRIIDKAYLLSKHGFKKEAREVLKRYWDEPDCRGQRKKAYRRTFIPQELKEIRLKTLRFLSKIKQFILKRR